MRLFVSAAEPSGDALAAPALSALASRTPCLDAFGLGGPELSAAGLFARRRTEEASASGLVELARHVPRLARLRRRLVELGSAAELALLVDAPDLHLGLARALAARGVPAVMLAPPQIWAWRPWRAKAFARAFATLLALFPFEREAWARAGADVVVAGHPLVDEAIPEIEPEPRTLAILAGGRRAQFARQAPVLVAAAERLVSAHRIDRARLVLAPGVAPEGLPRSPWLEVVAGDRMARRRAIARSAVTFVSAGTASLEVALLARPEVVVAKLPAATYLAMRGLATIREVALPNLIVGGGQVPELLQDALTVDALVSAHAAQADPKARLAAERLAARLRAEIPSGCAERVAAVVHDRWTARRRA